MKRKSALAIIAIEKGFKSWAELKCQLPFVRGGFLNHWFANYEQAKSHHKSKGGFLCLIKINFLFVMLITSKTLASFRRPDWKLIGFDWTNPGNNEAWKRLYKKWAEINDENSYC